MKNKFKVSEILVYYDVPEVFVAKDLVGTNYLAMLIEDDGILKYLSVAISPKRLSSFISGNLDLRKIFMAPEVDEFIILSNDVGDDNLFVKERVQNEVMEEWMPDEGFFLNNPFEDNSSIIEEVIEKDNAVIHLAISDCNDDFGIDTDDLGDVVKLYSMWIENSFKKAVFQRNVPHAKSFISVENYKLRAFASSAASFNLHLSSESNRDLFGNTMISFGLDKIDEVLGNYDNEKELLEVLKTIKGHGVSSLDKLLKKIVSRDLKIKYKWFAPNKKNIKSFMIDSDRAVSMLKVISSKTELTEEVKEFIGHFVQVDIPRKRWSLQTVDEKIISGEIHDGGDLEGITVQTVMYKLKCQEIIEEIRVSEKEKIRYIFLDVEEL